MQDTELMLIISHLKYDIYQCYFHRRGQITDPTWKKRIRRINRQIYYPENHHLIKGSSCKSTYFQ
jgi:hypothetical protein